MHITELLFEYKVNSDNKTKRTDVTVVNHITCHYMIWYSIYSTIDRWLDYTCHFIYEQFHFHFLKICYEYKRYCVRGNPDMLFDENRLCTLVTKIVIAFYVKYYITLEWIYTVRFPRSLLTIIDWYINKMTRFKLWLVYTQLLLPSVCAHQRYTRASWSL